MSVKKWRHKVVIDSPAANLEWRYKELMPRCMKDQGFAKAVWQACKEDVVFFFSAFCWLYEPRPRFDEFGRQLPKVIPFVPWEHQIPAIDEIKKNLGITDIAVFKSRGEGFSWIAVLLALHDWLFEDMAKVGLVSNTEKKADDPGNMDSLMAKIDWELEKLPEWISGVKDVHYTRNKSDHSLVNLRNGSQINAFAATSDAGRAGRYKWFLADELAFWDRPKDREFMEAVRESTECRLGISTPNGSVGAFADLVHIPSNAVRIRIHWTQNPAKNRGLYKMIDGEPVAVDPIGNPLPPEYFPPNQDVRDMFSRLRKKGFRLEGMLRSPWYDKQCDRGDATPQSIAQELDLDFGGSMYKVFPPEFAAKANESVMPALLSGSLGYHPQTLVQDFCERHDGEMKLWCHLDGNGNTPVGTYAVSADIGSGLGGSHTSNSVCEVIDRTTREQVAEFVSNTIEPSDFGELCVVIAKWFHDGYLGWEANFGGGFTKRVMDLRYNNVYYRTIHWKKSNKKTKEVGWWTDDRSKEMMFSDLIRRVRAGEVVIRSEELVRECGEYIRSGPQSKIEHAGSISTTDESSRGKAHGDRVIAFALGVQLLDDRPLLESDKKAVRSVPPNSLAARVQQWELEDKSLDEWDDRTLWDTAHNRGFDDF